MHREREPPRANSRRRQSRRGTLLPSKYGWTNKTAVGADDATEVTRADSHRGGWLTGMALTGGMPLAMARHTGGGWFPQIRMRPASGPTLPPSRRQRGDNKRPFKQLQPRHALTIGVAS